VVENVEGVFKDFMEGWRRLKDEAEESIVASGKRGRGRELQVGREGERRKDVLGASQAPSK
jgi:hypothetical protein